MKKEVKFAFLCVKEIPMGRVMLADLIEAGFMPGLIIEEDSPRGAARRKYYEEAMKRMPPTVEEMVAKHRIPHLTVSSHNGEECQKALTEMQPDLIVLGSCYIIKPHIFNIAKDGCINTHPGLLPLVRGLFPVAWSIYHDHPCGNALHFVDEKLDTGPLIYNETFPVNRGDTIEDLLEKACHLAGNQIVRACKAYVSGTLKTIPPQGPSNYYSNPPEEVFNTAKRKLADQTYKHFAD
jgi:methionyl-tRNA formyltransferase